jgi:ADP-ribose pyrophosphatase YjhB (NUDIX family)
MSVFKNNKQKRSYGIICFSGEQHDLKVLLVKKAVTYNFVQFINGIYKHKNDLALSKLFCGMTFNEKIEILNGNFASLWHRIYPGENVDNLNFRKKASVFNEEMKYRGLDCIKKLMSKSTAIDTFWEIPKGRSNFDEKPFETAIREFNEETQNQVRDIEILWHKAPYVESYRDYGITYINTYYYAIYKGTIEIINTDFRKGEIGEIVSARWFSVDQLLKTNGLIFTTCYIKTLLKNAKKHIKTHKKHTDLLVST